MNKSLFILLSSLFVSNVFAGNKDELHYETMRPAVFTAARLGQVGVAHNGKDFAVIKDGKVHPVKSYLVDKTLRGKSTEQIARYLAHHAIEIKEGSDHEFSLEAHNRTLGGGAGGTVIGVVVGKTLVYGVSYGTIGIATWGVGVVSGPVAAGVFAKTASSVATPWIELASNKVAIGFGILFGVGSGPV